MAKSPSVESVIKYLKVSKEDAIKIKKHMTSVEPETAMERINIIMKGFGVEGLRDENAWVGGYWQNTIALYVNKGDTYDTTLVFDTENARFLITSWGDFYEGWLYKHQKEL